MAQTNVNKVDVSVFIDENGDAIISELWSVPSQKVSSIEKVIDCEFDVKLNDVAVSNNETNYKKVNKWERNKSNIFQVIEKKDKKIIKFATTNANTVYKIKYSVPNFIVQFNDTYGIYWDFLDDNKELVVFEAFIDITSKYKFSEANTALYGIGENIGVSFDDGAIKINASRLNRKASVILLTTFNDLKFKNTSKINKTSSDVYDSLVSRYSFFDEMIKLITSNTIKAVSFILIIMAISIVIIRIVRSRIGKREYANIEVYDDVDKNRQEYIDYVPCDGNVLELGFLADFFGIMKNRSDIIGALLLKWYYEGICDLQIKEEHSFIKLINRDKLKNISELSLYDILYKASNNGVLDNNKFVRYLENNYDELITWYNTLVDDVVRSELDNKNMYIKRKFSVDKVVLGKNLVKYVEEIYALKRYLLNFNQVPRKTELTEEGYKYLLIAGELLGIGEHLAKEIVRKNPDNVMAKKLLEFQSITFIYKTSFDVAYKNKKMKKKAKRED